MSRAFINEDSGSRPTGRRFVLPSPDDAGFDAAAARVILEAARDGDTGSAEEATGTTGVSRAFGRTSSAFSPRRAPTATTASFSSRSAGFAERAIAEPSPSKCSRRDRPATFAVMQTPLDVVDVALDLMRIDSTSGQEGEVIAFVDTTARRARMAQPRGFR